MTGSFGIVLDVVVLLLLAATIFYASQLNKALDKLRGGKAELAGLIRSLSEAVARAELSVRNMKQITGQYDETMHRQMASAKSLIEELSLINDTANGLADRLEKSVAASRQASLASASMINSSGAPLASAPSPTAKNSRVLRPGKRLSVSDEIFDEEALEDNFLTAKKPEAENNKFAERGNASSQVPASSGKTRAETELFAAIEHLKKAQKNN
ncbi:MAG: DUF6468 domain-containing protein [Alphaproteobacteria bacterium]